MLLLLAVVLVWFYFCLPNPLFKDPYSTVLNDKDGMLIGAKIAKDGQWRFPLIDNVPSAFEDAIITYEDKRFRSHLGVDFLALGRALVQNMKAGKVKSGASTLSMQVIRLSRKGKPRTVYQKVIEIILALRLECSYSKDDILRMYASHAPFGGNVVGLETASWRYFKKDPSKLSDAESAMLAVLPNAPSLIHLSRNRKRLVEKRNSLLFKMKEEGLISKDDYELSLLEKIPESPYPLPSIAPHFLEYVHLKTPQKITQSTIDRHIQQTIIEVANFHHAINAQSDIHNLAVLILDTKSGEVVGYLGNAPNTNAESAVDMVQAYRSSGSVLKPFLYAFSLDGGKMLPHSLVKDVPTTFQGFNPKNFNREYSGATPGDIALSRSLNVPAVISLQKYGVQPFINKLNELGISSINKSADHYGLSLILGGGEVSLWNLCGAYASLGRILLRFNNEDSKYSKSDIHQPRYISTKYKEAEAFRSTTINAGSIYQTFEAMREVSRPNEEGEWQQFESSVPIAWKTGTSYSHRDAWAVGVSPKYTIGVWVGNANGEGRNGLLGVTKAGPVLFDIVNRLPKSPFFEEPVDDLVATPTCTKSGFLASTKCESIDTIFAVPQGQNSEICPYHTLIHLDQNGNRVSSRCESPSKMNHVKWFELPPTMAHYYRNDHPEYRMIPSFRLDCMQEAASELMSFIYPNEESKIYLPIDIDGERENVIFKATHRDPKGILYWHLDENYLGYTEDIHTMGITATKGEHRILIVDEMGNSVSKNFEIIQ